MKTKQAFLSAFLSILISFNLSAQGNTKAQVTQLYKDYFCVADQLDPKWSGDFLQLNQGDISEDYKGAVLKRLLFMRSLAGVSNIPEIDANLSSQAQKLSFFLSINGNTHYLNGVWDPFKVVNSNAGIPQYDPFYALRLYSPELQAIAKNSHIGTYDTISHALVDIIKGRNGEDGTTSGGEWDKVPDVGFPLNTLKLLSPQLNRVGLGSVEIETPIILFAAGGLNLDSVSSGVMTTNNVDLNSSPTSGFNPLVWPPAGYVPYIISGPKWIAHQAGADFRGAYVSVKASNDPSFNYKAKLVEREEATPINTIAWSMSAFPSQGRAFNFPTGNLEERVYNVTIGNILFNGETKELDYQVIEYNPFSDFTKTRIKLDIPNKVSGSIPNYIRFRAFTEDGCLIRLVDPPLLTGSIPGRRNLVIKAAYSTAPTGPFKYEGVKLSPYVYDVMIDRLDDEGFYIFELQTENAALDGNGTSSSFTTLARSEVVQLSKTYGYRRLTEQFKEPSSEVDISTLDPKIKSQKPGDPKPELTPNPNPGSDKKLEKLMKKYKKLKEQNKQCSLKKKKRQCKDSLCQTQCAKVKKNLKSSKLAIINMTGIKPK